MERVEHNHAEPTDELLSAYVDDAVDVVERRRAEGYVTRCPACAEEARELRTFKSLMSDVPTLQPPRSFTLDPYAAPQQRRLLFPTLRWATLVATLLLVVVLGVDGLGAINSGGAASPMAGTASSAPQFSARQAPAPGFGGDATGLGGGAESAASAAAMPESAMMAPAASPAAKNEEDASASTAAEAADAPMEAMDALNPTGTSTLSEAQPEAAQQADLPPAAASGDPLSNTRPAQEPVDPAAAAGGASALQNNDSAQFTQPSTSLAERDESGVDTLRIAQIALAALVLGLGVAAAVAWRRGL